MDEFLQGINASIYLKWILMQNNHYSLNIKVDDNDNNTIIISNEIVIGKIIYYGKGIFEEELNDRQTKEKIFYLHFQLTHFNHAVELFKEMINCALEATNRPQVKCKSWQNWKIYHMRFLQQDIHAYLRLLMIMILF